MAMKMTGRLQHLHRAALAADRQQALQPGWVKSGNSAATTTMGFTVW